LDNNRTRSIIEGLESLIDLCLVEGNEPEKWKECINYYKKTMTMIRQKEDFTNAQIMDFQEQADMFIQIWYDLHTKEGATNYIHMLASGHISEYLYYWRNLYAHSQQGWEALNSLIKTFYFRRTARGGVSNRGNGEKSRLKPIARWFSRRIMWMCGTKFSFMVSELEKREAPSSIDNDGGEDEFVHDDSNII
jgi:hypothetical protein